jgi:hypothetical protein
MQIEQQQDAAEGCFGGKKLMHAKIVELVAAQSGIEAIGGVLCAGGNATPGASAECA